MTNHVLVEAGIVLQSDRTGKAPKGWIEAPDPVTPGFLYDGHDFSPPRPALEDRLIELADRRRHALAVGHVEVGGVSVKTDLQTINALTTAYVKAKADPSYIVSNWRTGPGSFVTLDAVSIITIGDAVTAFVQACFDNESVLSHQLATDPNIDLTKGWP